MAMKVPPRTGDFPTFIDSTMRSALTSCETKWYWNWIRRFQPAETSPDLHAGGAFASGLETARKDFYLQGKSQEDSILSGAEEVMRYWGNYEPPEGHVKQMHVVLGLLEDYFREYPMDTDFIQPYRDANGRPAVEFTFAIPIPGTKHPVTGEPILYKGRFDLIGQYNGMLFVVDEKTTKQLGATWSQQWDLRAQFIGYVWAARILGNIPVVGAIVRGCGLYKTEPFYRYAQAIVYIDDWMIERWLLDLQLDILAAVAAWESGMYRQDYDHACTAYSGCENRTLCKSQNPESWVGNYYIRNNWDPTAKNPEESKDGTDDSPTQGILSV